MNVEHTISDDVKLARARASEMMGMARRCSGKGPGFHDSGLVTLNNGCKLGKVAPSSAQSRSAWSFYAGSGNWSAQIGDAISVFNDANILSVSWNAFLQRYLAVYSPPFSQNVVIRTSVNPEGPWSSEIVAFVAMQPRGGNVYDARTHAEYDSSNGLIIYVTYSRSTPAAFSSEVRLVGVEFKSSGTQP
jgi:hypothetical protein